MAIRRDRPPTHQYSTKYRCGSRAAEPARDEARGRARKRCGLLSLGRRRGVACASFAILATVMRETPVGPVQCLVVRHVPQQFFDLGIARRELEQLVENSPDGCNSYIGICAHHYCHSCESGASRTGSRHDESLPYQLIHLLPDLDHRHLFLWSC